MIRLSLQRKGFLATFALTTAMALLLVLAVRWNLQQGFERYTGAAELARIDWLIENLENEYAAYGNWEFLKIRPEQTWRRLLRPRQEAGNNAPQNRERLPNQAPGRALNPPPASRQAPAMDGPARDFSPPPPPPWEQDSPPPRPFAERPGEQNSLPTPAQNRAGPPHDILRIAPRLTLLDVDGSRLAGNVQSARIVAERPIRHNGVLVGRLGLQVAQASTSHLDDAFLASQTRNLLLFGLAALSLSLLAAWLLARHLVAPIRDLASGVRKIADGGLDARIPVSRSDELGELATDFNHMADRLARQEELRRAWISDSSHELRTPLAVLRAEIEAMQDGVRPADAATLARLHKQVQQLAKLVDDLRLTLDREPGSADLDMAVLSPLAIVEETIEAFRERYAEAKIEIDTAGLAKGNWRGRGDAGRLALVFANLFENTLRYTDRGGRLRIAARADGQRFFLQFDDTAPAPPPSALPRLFERFFRAEPSRSRELGGSGLGLAICKTLIEAHGGRIAAAQSKLGGLSIRIELPLERSV